MRLNYQVSGRKRPNFPAIIAEAHRQAVEVSRQFPCSERPGWRVVPDIYGSLNGYSGEVHIEFSFPNEDAAKRHSLGAWED